ncbi:MAG TPA: tRNA (adenosine(37)-N6)-dimethylallyltransferase MiaA [Thermodesulfobacteriota bacterium]
MAPGQRPRILAIVGPTASGKTALAVELAERFGLPVLGADSLQVYRYLDIGSAKPTVEERRRAAHHLIDLVDPDEPFTAADYAAHGRRVIEALRIGRPGGPPGALLVGGTGLYVRALTRGLIPAPAVAAAVRARIEAEVAADPEAARARLAAADPETARRLAPADRVRLVRALEILEATGEPPSALRAAHRFGDSVFDVAIAVLRVPVADLDRAIAARVDRMLAAGLVDEVRSLHARGYGPELKPMRALGYRQVGDYLAGRLTLAEAAASIKTETRRYAKRQRTWWRGEREARWVDASQARVTLAELARRHLHL